MNVGLSSSIVVIKKNTIGANLNKCKHIKLLLTSQDIKRALEINKGERIHCSDLSVLLENVDVREMIVKFFLT